MKKLPLRRKIRSGNLPSAPAPLREAAAGRRKRTGRSAESRNAIPVKRLPSSTPAPSSIRTERPIAGATLYAPSRLKNPPRLLSDVGLAEKGKTDGEGRFSVSFTGEDFPALLRPMPLIVHQPGYGVEWLDVTPSGEPPPADAVLQPERLSLAGSSTRKDGRSSGQMWTCWP